MPSRHTYSTAFTTSTLRTRRIAGSSHSKTIYYSIRDFSHLITVIDCGLLLVPSYSVVPERHPVKELTPNVISLFILNTLLQ